VPDYELKQPDEPENTEKMPDYFDAACGVSEDTTIVDSLTDEDKLYLRVKWGKAYKPDEWV